LSKNDKQNKKDWQKLNNDKLRCKDRLKYNANLKYKKTFKDKDSSNCKGKKMNRDFNLKISEDNRN